MPDFFPCRLFRRPLRARKVVYWLLIPELALTVALLVLFALEAPDLFRTTFWRIGFENKLNSNPDMILYAQANHRPLPAIPFVWSPTLTTFNETISIISLFVLITKLISIIMHVYFPLVATFTSLAMTALYVTSVYGQAGPDYADPRYPSPTPWYIRMRCGAVRPYGAILVFYCHMAKATLALTVLMFVLYLVNLSLSVWSMLPNKKWDEKAEYGDDNNDDDVSAMAKETVGREMQVPKSSMAPGHIVPYTPPTQALDALNRL